MSLFFFQNNTTYGFASCVCFEDSLQFFVPAKHLNHIELAVLVSKCVGALPATDRLIKTFIIYLLPLFVITSKRIFQKIQMYKTTKKIYWNVKTKKLFH